MPPVAAQMFFTATNPALWAGALALGVPLLIHLLTRRTPKTMVFPTLQFIRAARASQSHLYRLRHLLMLLVRTLLIFLILLAFLKPILSYRSSLTSQNNSTSTATVILLDASASMGYSDGGVTAFSHAKVAARKLIDHHRANDKVNLIIMGATPYSCFDQPSDNPFYLRKTIQDIKLTQERCDIDAAFAEAIRQLEEVTGSKRQIHIISDFQRTNWSAVNFEVVPKEIDLLFIPVGLSRTANRAITDVTIQPALPTVSESVQIVCKVANYSDQTSVVPLQLHFLDGQMLKQDILLEPHITASANFRIRARKSGHYEARLTIPDDGLSADNRRYFTFDVADKLNVLLVSDDHPDDAKAAGRFLSRAINPFLQQKHATAIASVIRSEQLDIFEITKAQLVILSGINELTREAAELLIDYLKNGGSVVYFHVGGGDAHNLGLLAEASNGEFVLPFKLTGQTDLSVKGSYASLAEANFDHDLLRKFKESGDLGDLRFYRFFSTERVKQKGRILMRYDDRNIAMAEKTVGSGSILLCNFSCSLAHSDIARSTLFVPLVHEIVKCLRPQTSRTRSFEVGDQCFLTTQPVAKDDPVEFRNPADKPINGNIEIGQNEAAVFFPKADECGFYRVCVKDKRIGSVAVNINELESDLETLNVPNLRELTKIERQRFYAASGNLASLDRLVEGRPLWHYFLMAAICLLGVEQILVMIWKR